MLPFVTTWPALVVWPEVTVTLVGADGAFATPRMLESGEAVVTTQKISPAAAVVALTVSVML